MRTAPSHIRFGHFEWFAALGQKTEVKKLADFVIEHYYPQCQGAQKYVDFFNQVVKRTAKMLADWQAQGFAHGPDKPRSHFPPKSTPRWWQYSALAWQWNKDIRE
jgi:uncharacterized protein YdiU (UPF0061 family)